LLSHVWFYLDCKGLVQLFLFLVWFLLKTSSFIMSNYTYSSLKLLPLVTNFVTPATASLLLLSAVSICYHCMVFEFRVSCNNAVIYVLNMASRFPLKLTLDIMHIISFVLTHTSFIFTKLHYPLTLLIGCFNFKKLITVELCNMLLHEQSVNFQATLLSYLDIVMS
jgi:hypothetical protein